MRDSANDAFFTAESLENLSEALVREGIQNSLDAARRSDGNIRQVRIRICFVPSADAKTREYLRKIFNETRKNFESGLLCPKLDQLFGEDCGYLVFEDFGTKGLAGDIQEWRLEQAEQNAFFSFFRAEGRSSKSGEKLGRWGIGKQVFPSASRLHAMLGLTVRGDTPKAVMMGSAVIRTHSVDGKDFQPDAWFGCRDRPEQPVMPVTDTTFLEQFAATFGLKRGTEPGLSIVVPSVDDRVNADDLRRGILRSFFWPILLGDLVVDLESAGETWKLDAETLAAHRSLLPPNESAVIEFAAWASTVKPGEIVRLPEEAAKRPDWRTIIESMLPEPKMAEIRSKLVGDHKVAVRIPVRVRPKDGTPERMSFFTVFITSCRDSGYRPIFLRDGIVITDVRSPQMSGIRSLVVVDDPPLAGLLGDAEGVNHTQWQKDSPKFHNRYVSGGETIKFVTRSVYEVMQRLHAAETKGDPSLLLHIFYLPTVDGESEPTKKAKDEENGTVPKEPKPVPPPKPKMFSLEPVKGGFILKPGNQAIETFPLKIHIEAGYAVRRGNPIKRWAKDDFTFIRLPLRQEPKASGVIVSREDGNTLELEIRKTDFQFGITGFDTKRDLVVRAVEIKGDNEANV